MPQTRRFPSISLEFGQDIGHITGGESVADNYDDFFIRNLRFYRL